MRTLCSILCFAAVSIGSAAEWPQWQGPNRDAKSTETGLLKSWPEGGPKLLWATTEDLGLGYSTVSIAGGRIYTTGMFGKDGYLFALDLDGQLKWKVRYGPEYLKFGKGSRSTPTVDGDRIYIMSGMGLAACFGLDGNLKWSVDTEKVFGGRNIRWGICESPLIDGDKVILTPGGTDASMVALDKMTGKTLWTTKGLSDRSAYCSPLHVKEGKKDLYVTLTEAHIVGVSPEGKVLWQVPYQGQCQAHPNTPVYHDGQVYITSGYNAGGVMLKLTDDGSGAEVLWKDDVLDVHHGGVVLVDGFLYGANWGSNARGDWVCLDWKTGKPRYETTWKCKGSISYADGMLYCYEEKDGHVALVEATPEGFKPISTFQVTQGHDRHWAHPVVCGGRLYIRHGKTLLCHDVKAK